MNENLQLALTLFLIHAAWQGTVIAVLVAAADKVFGKASSSFRYRLFFLALLFMLLFPALTSLRGVLALPIPSASIAQPAPASEELPAATPRNAVVSGSEAVWLQAVQVSTQYLVPVWVIGVLAMTVRWTGASYVLRRRIRRSSLAGERWRETVDDLRRALRIERAVRVLQVEWLAAPATIGWLVPILLLPVSALSGLPPQQIEAIIAHELAHIRRNDYMANLVQVAAETLLFFHPAVWWLSAKIRQEREELCDAIAVSQCGNPQIYAHALLAIACGRTAPRLIMAADRGSLSERVFRILGVPRRGSGVRSGSIAVALALLVATLTVTATRRLAGSNPDSLPLPPAAALISPFTAEQVAVVYDAGGPTMFSRTLTALRSDGSQAQFRTFRGRIGQFIAMRKVDLADGSYAGPVEVIAGLALGGDAWRHMNQLRMAKLKQHSTDCVVNLSGEVMVGAGPTLFGFRTVEVSWTDGTNLQRTRLAAPELGCFNLQELVQVKTPQGSFRPSLEMRTVALGTIAPEQELFAPLFNPFRMPAIQRAVPVSIKGRVRGSGSFTVGSQLL